MKDGVDRVHSFGKPERERMSTNLSNDIEGAEVLFSEFLRWSSRAKVLSFYKRLLSDLEVGCRRSLAIGWSLVTLLSFRDARAYLLVEIVEINDKILSARRGLVS